MNYYDEYTSTVKIKPLDKSGCPVYSIELIKAYPLSLGAIEYSYTSTDTVASCSVTFSHEYWINNEFD